DVTTMPQSMDLGFLNPKRVLEGVYAVDEDTLKICVNRQTEGVKERPLGFSTEGKPDWRLLVFRREKEAKGEGTDDLPGYVGMAIRAVPDREELIIAQVLDGGPAKKAGLKKEDILIQVGGREATDLQAVIRMVQQAKPGSELTIRIKRGGKEQDI